MQANAAAERNTLDAINGNVPAGAIAQLTRAGLSDGSAALSSSIVPGSSGSFGLARNLGVGYGAFQQQNLQNLAALDAANPQRGFGLTGAQALGVQNAQDSQYNSVLIGNQQNAQSVALANSTGMNASNQGGFAGALQSFAAQQAGQQQAINTGVGLAANAFGQYARQTNFWGNLSNSAGSTGGNVAYIGAASGMPNGD